MSNSGLWGDKRIRTSVIVALALLILNLVCVGFGASLIAPGSLNSINYLLLFTNGLVVFLLLAAMDFVSRAKRRIHWKTDLITAVAVSLVLSLVGWYFTGSSLVTFMGFVMGFVVLFASLWVGLYVGEDLI